jgi:taurine dioxygenase
MTQLEELATRTYEPPLRHIEVTQLGGVIGAVVSGIRVGAGAGADEVAELRSALLRHRVVFLQDQNHVTDVGQYEFAQLLGEVTRPHPTLAGDGQVILPIDSEQGKANSWHTDVTFVDRIPAISVRRAVRLPAYGGTTVWANTVEAYRRLHPALQALAGGLRAVHSNLYDYAAHQTRLGGLDVKEQRHRDEFRHLVFETEHPVVRLHPETGEPSLLLGHFVRSCTG